MMIGSSDGGKNWVKLGPGVATKEYPETIVVDDVIAGRMYAGCRNGDFYVSDDSGESWRSADLKLKVDDLSSITLAHA
jgi:photosystem II stability/assembly factor-like uncharacterized protein